MGLWFVAILVWLFVGDLFGDIVGGFEKAFGSSIPTHDDKSFTKLAKLLKMADRVGLFFALLSDLRVVLLRNRGGCGVHS